MHPVCCVRGVGRRTGDKVSKEKMVFQCNAHPISLFCGQVGYEHLTTT